MKRLLFLASLLLLACCFPALALNNVKSTLVEVQLVAVSQSLLLAAKTKEPVDSFINILRNTPETELKKQLITDAEKKAFWINIYNAFTQVMLSKNPDQYKKRSSFFGSRQVVIAGRQLSLDDIEHGILRHSKVKWSLGYFNKLFTPAFEKENRVDTLDYRIHFALNCGAKSCPPIAFYKPEQLDKQLDMATKVYLKGESEYKEPGNKVYVPALMGWFRRDFGGKRQMKLLLVKLDIIPAGKNPVLKFKSYDWNLYLENYKNE